MRSLILATSVALALGTVPAVAQTASRVTGANTTGGSTTTTTTSSSAASAATAPATGSSTGADASSTASGGSSNAFGTNTTTTVPTNSTPPFGRGGSFSNDSGNSALGTSAGQTSSGTAAGNSSSGLDSGSATLDPATVGTVGSGPATTNPDGTVLGATGVNVVGERVPASNGVSAAPAPSISIVNTPTFDQAAREGRAKEQARKARGQEPRVYGIAPRTENDLTHQMPDDKIIRY